MRKRYFNNVKHLIEYATKEVELEGRFDFTYEDESGNKEYFWIKSIKGIKEMKKIDDNTFKLHDRKFNLDFLIPEYLHECVFCEKVITNRDDVYWVTGFCYDFIDKIATCSEKCANKLKEKPIKLIESKLEKVKSSKIKVEV